MPSRPESARSEPPVASPRDGGRLQDWLLWPMLALAFSPVLIDLVSHYAERPAIAYGALFIALFVWETMHRPRGPARPGLGLGLVVAGLAIELVFSKVGWMRFARPGLALAMIGLASLRGRATPQLALLALFAVPIPGFAVAAFEPLLLPAVAFWLRVLGGIGSPMEIGQEEVFTRDASLAVSPYDAGIPLAVLIAGLCAYAGVRRNWSLGRIARRAALLCPLALPIQMVALGLALWALASDSPDLARVGLGAGTWLATAGVGGWLILRHGRARRAAEAAPRSPCPAAPRESSSAGS